jgi:hypothetical protein
VKTATAPRKRRIKLSADQAQTPRTTRIFYVDFGLVIIMICLLYSLAPLPSRRASTYTYPLLEIIDTPLNPHQTSAQTPRQPFSRDAVVTCMYTHALTPRETKCTSPRTRRRRRPSASFLWRTCRAPRPPPSSPLSNKPASEHGSSQSNQDVHYHCIIFGALASDGTCVALEILKVNIYKYMRFSCSPHLPLC